MSTSGEGYEERGTLRQFFSNPVVGFTGTLASVIGVILAIYFYLEAKKTRELTYYIHPVRAIIVKTGEASQLSVTYAGKEVKTDMTAVQVAVWNRGGETIRKSHVLQPLVIRTATPIVEGVVRKETRPGIVGLKLDESEMQNGRLGISWDILEENDGGIVQLIVAVASDVKVTAEAVIEGQREIRELAFSGSIKSPLEQYSAGLRARQFYGLFYLVMGCFLGLMVFLVRYRLGPFQTEAVTPINRAIDAKATDLESESPPKPQLPWDVEFFLRIVVPIMALGGVGMGLYNLLFQRPLAPPFDF